MWVSKKKWDSVQKRLSDAESGYGKLKREISDLKFESKLTFPKSPPEELGDTGDYFVSMHNRFARDVRSVVRDILNHLGLKYEYQDEQPEKVTLKKAPKKRPTK